LQLIVSKLVGNAIKFTNPEGRVAIRAEAQPRSQGGAGEKDADGVVRIAVTDTGRGIPTDPVATLFDHPPNAPRTPPAGPGPALAIARGSLQLQGRTSAVESRVDEGSAFSFTLPLAPPSPT